MKKKNIYLYATFLYITMLHVYDRDMTIFFSNITRENFIVSFLIGCSK